MTEDLTDNPWDLLANALDEEWDQITVDLHTSLYEQTPNFKSVNDQREWLLAKRVRAVSENLDLQIPEIDRMLAKLDLAERRATRKKGSRKPINLFV